MHVGVGYSEDPDPFFAGREAVESAFRQAQRSAPCDLVLLFATSSHDPVLLREAVCVLVGPDVPIIGGAAIGTMTNNRFGYAGDQICVALVWLDGVSCDLVVEQETTRGGDDVGRRLGQKLADLGATAQTTVLLFYDAIDRTGDDLRLIMATPILDAMQETLGFLPDLVGAGMQGDYSCSSTHQWIGSTIAQHTAMALVFSGDLHIDSTIMHGCRPATPYYTVTRADRQTILEINGQPALTFLDKILGPGISVEDFPFFLTFGVNSGEKWAEFDENHYASRLCLGIDPARNGVIMFEPDMVEGTEFQIMYRSLDLDYMAPKIEGLFNQLDGRRPVFALYIDCGGRAAGYAGVDLEDALVVQKTVADRVPLLGVYTGVEIASIMGRPRALDWTGVFCLFSVAK